MTKFWLLILVGTVTLLAACVEFKVVKVATISLLALYKGRKERPRS